MENITQWIFPIAILVIFVVLIIVPLRRRDKKTRQMLDAIKAGDTIKTIGGIYGKVVSVKEDLVVIETGPENARITFAKGAVATVEAATASNEDSGEKVEKAAEADAEKK